MNRRVIFCLFLLSLSACATQPNPPVESSWEQRVYSQATPPQNNNCDPIAFNCSYLSH